MNDHTNFEPDFLREILRETAAWFAVRQRSLPWREDADPYHVWLSEIMLQQTRIEAVIPYYRRFLEAAPDIASLAALEEDRLMKLWEGLGYYSRVRNLQKAAKQVVAEYGGALPADYEALRALPGVGDYTAGAVASIAFGLPQPAVDGNVLRVITRVCDCREDITSPPFKAGLRDALRDVYPSGAEASRATAGLMELGEVVCVPNAEPLCADCPLRRLCRGAENWREIPVRPEKRPRRIEDRTILILSSGGKIAVRRRPKGGLLGGLWEFPGLDGHLNGPEILAAVTEMGLSPLAVTPLGEGKHVFTHIEWHMLGCRVECETPRGGFEWKTPEEIRSDCAIPTALAKWKNLL